jgi:hypothetical protein
MDWTDITYSLNPTWPDWLPEWAALPTFLGAAAVLTLLTLWTYSGVREARISRILVVLLLRLGALAVALLVALRPSFAVQVLEGLEPSKLLIVVDFSQSMTTPDDFNNLPRWDNARRILSAPRVVSALKRLSSDQQIEIVYYQAAESLAPFDPQGTANGKRTDIGGWLHELHQKHVGQDKLRGLLIFSDGADNGTRFPVLDEARKWAGVCPIYTFGHGKPQEDSERKDIIVASIKATPSPVPSKTKLTVTGVVHALKFKDTVVRVELWSQGSREKEPTLLGEVEKHVLKEEKNNQIVLVRDAPENPDEYKLTLKVEKVEGEADVTNNEASTYVQVTKEGVAILWVEGRKRPYEPVFALRALGKDKRFRVYYTEADPRAAAGKRDWYGFEQRHYDVIVIGDLSAQQFAGGNPAVFEEVCKLVEDKKAGLMMLGGIDTFGRGGWDKTPIARPLPVRLDTDKQLNNQVRVRPAEAVLKLPRPNPYPFLILDDDDNKNRELWEKKFEPLDGMAYVGTPRPGATVLARGNGDDPILVAGAPNGRILVFGGDTTWKAWVRPRTVAAYTRFWRQAMLWLANQDDRTGNLWVELKKRRLNAGGSDRLEFTFGLRDKENNDIKDAQYAAKALGPGGEVINVPRSVPEKNYQRGTLTVPAVPGEYRLEVCAKGTDKKGNEVADTAIRHFVVVSENLELKRKTPDHELLADIATASHGKFFQADEALLLKVLGDIRGEVRKESHATSVRWPDWDRRPATDAWPDQFAGLWGSSALIWFLAFAALLAAEWSLRRMWGMV